MQRLMITMEVVALGKDTIELCEKLGEIASATCVKHEALLCKINVDSAAAKGDPLELAAFKKQVSDEIIRIKLGGLK
jgi:hypothetical protein